MVLAFVVKYSSGEIFLEVATAAIAAMAFSSLCLPGSLMASFMSSEILKG